MAFCLPHRVSLVLAAEGIPVHWKSIKVPKSSGSCPFCRATNEGEESLEKAIKKWVAAARIDPSVISDSPKDSKKSSDKGDSTMNYDKQQNNTHKIREENNRKIVRELTRGKSGSSNKNQASKPAKQKPNHLRLV